MTQPVFIILCALIGTSYTADAECGPGEVIVTCPAICETDVCPKNENYSLSCENQKACPAPACKCRFNYSRANNGTCIPTRECPAFLCTRPNEEYKPCPGYCPTDDCSQASINEECPFLSRILIVVECRPACKCKKGFWRKDGVCVPFSECPGIDENKALATIIRNYF